MPSIGVDSGLAAAYVKARLDGAGQITPESAAGLARSIVEGAPPGAQDAAKVALLTDFDTVLPDPVRRAMCLAVVGSSGPAASAAPPSAPGSGIASRIAAMNPPPKMQSPEQPAPEGLVWLGQHPKIDWVTGADARRLSRILKREGAKPIETMPAVGPDDTIKAYHEDGRAVFRVTAPNLPWVHMDFLLDKGQWSKAAPEDGPMAF